MPKPAGSHDPVVGYVKSITPRSTRRRRQRRRPPRQKARPPRKLTWRGDYVFNRRFAGQGRWRRDREMNDTAPRSREFNEADIPTEQPASEAHTRISRSHEYAGGPSGVEASAGKGPKTPDRYNSSEAALLTQPDRRLPRSRRIRKRSEYLYLQRVGQRRVCQSFVVITRPRAAGSRIGITASRRTGDAVTRNRVKRLVREFFRQQRSCLTAEKDIVVIARPQAAELSYAEVTRELAAALKINVHR
jgi:ribonuclease P protein component